MKLIVSNSIIAALGLAMSFHAGADGRQKLSEMTSKPDETLASFAQKVGTELRGFAKNGNQACAAISFDPAGGVQKISMFMDGATPDCATQDENTYSVHVNTNAKISVGWREFVSQDNEKLEDFLLRISPLAEQFTVMTGWEVCGFVAQGKNGQYGLRLSSNRGAISCNISSNNVPFGMTAMRMTYHTHPEGNARPTAADAEFYADNPATSGRMVKVGKPVKIGIGNKGSDIFSDGDYAAPGYLAAEGKLMYQEGKGSERDVGTFARRQK